MNPLATRALLVGLAAFMWLPAFSFIASAQSGDSAGAAFILCENHQDDQLDVVLLLDKSGSIRSAAPEEERFAAVDRFIEMLRRVSTETDREVQINVVLFDTETEVLGWQSVTNEEDVAQVTRDVATKWSDTQSRGDTDQIVAFATAFDLLEERKDSCRVTVMFTDGVIDTGNSSADPTDLDRAFSEACTDLSLDTGGPSLRERAEQLNTNEFVLLLEPKSTGLKDVDFRERLSHTMTLFTSITGDTTPPAIPEPNGEGNAFDPEATDPDVLGLQCEPKYPQTGLVLSARSAAQLEAYFLKLGAELGPSEPGVRECPEEIDSGTERLPHGSLIRQMQIISFNGGETVLRIDDFEIRTPEGTTSPAGDAFTVVKASTVELQLEIRSREALPGGWVLQTVGDPGDGTGYCVEVTARTDLTAVLSIDPNPALVSQDREDRVVHIAFEPEIDDYVFSFSLNGTTYTTSSQSKTVSLSPEMAAIGVDVSQGIVEAQGTELFSDLDVTVSSDIEVQNYSLSELPATQCESTTVTVASGEVPQSSTVLTDTGCRANPGTSVGGLQSYVRIYSTDDFEPDGRTTMTFLTGDDLELTSDWTKFSEPLEVNVRVDDLPNKTVQFSAGFTIEVTYGLSAEAASMPEDSMSEAHVDLYVDLLARSNSVLAWQITIAAAILAAILSLLLLWTFNRLTAQLPRASGFFYYEAGQLKDERLAIGVGLDPDKLGAARGGRGQLTFGDVGVRLKHPPLWRPLADSIGVLHAPGIAVADPTGPKEGTIPVGFASLVIAHRALGLEEVRYVVVVPKRGSRSGIDGVQIILSDRIRLERVERRLPDLQDGDDPDDAGPETPSVGPSGPGSPNPGPEPNQSNGPTLPG